MFRSETGELQKIPVEALEGAPDGSRCPWAPCCSRTTSREAPGARGTSRQVPR